MSVSSFPAPGDVGLRGYPPSYSRGYPDDRPDVLPTPGPNPSPDPEPSPSPMPEPDPDPGSPLDPLPTPEPVFLAFRA